MGYIVENQGLQRAFAGDAPAPCEKGRGGNRKGGNQDDQRLIANFDHGNRILLDRRR
ncbi:MAG: hypothetical protein P8Z80_19900 [Pseudolabrys sp.]